MRKDKYQGDNSNGEDDTYNDKDVKLEEGSYRYCISCWRSEPEVEFLPDSYDWQFKQRCVICERKYQQDFMKKYPSTKRRHRLAGLDKKEMIYYEEMMETERGFND